MNDFWIPFIYGFSGGLLFAAFCNILKQSFGPQTDPVQKNGSEVKAPSRVDSLP